MYSSFAYLPLKISSFLYLFEKLITRNRSYGNVICRCEMVSEAEIIEAIKKGHTTLDGIKFYTRAGMGRCQGGFCTYKIMKILLRETGMKPEEITKRGSGSSFIQGKISPDQLLVKKRP